MGNLERFMEVSREIRAERLLVDFPASYVCKNWRVHDSCKVVSQFVNAKLVEHGRTLLILSDENKSETIMWCPIVS